MGDDNDMKVAASLARIETLLEGMQQTVHNHSQRIQKLEIWFIRVSTGVVVWTFFTGTGPASLASILKVLVHP